MKAAIVALLVGAVIALEVQVLRQDAALRAERTERLRASASAKLAATPDPTKGADLDLQAKCAAQAARDFKDWGWDKHQTSGYMNHYSQGLNRCFIEVADTEPVAGTTEVTTSKHVFDAFEGRAVGDYMWQSRPSKKYWEVPPFMCTVTLPSGEKKACHSNDEFDELVKLYLEGG